MCGLTLQLVGRQSDIQLSHASGLYTRSHLIKRPCAPFLVAGTVPTKSQRH